MNEGLKEKLEEALKNNDAPREEETVSMQPAIIQTCTIKTKAGKSIECKFWIHTDKYFQYYEKGFEVEDAGNGAYIIKGDTVIIPNHEIRYVIIRNAASNIPENMFLALGGKKKLIIKVAENEIP